MTELLHELNNFERECRETNDALQYMDETIFVFDQALDAAEHDVAEAELVA